MKLNEERFIYEAKNWLKKISLTQGQCRDIANNMYRIADKVLNDKGVTHKER